MRRSLSAAISSVFGYICGLILMYFISVRYIFKKRNFKRRKILEMVIFFLSGVLGTGLTFLTVYVSVNFFNMPALIAKGAAIGVSFICVYGFRKFLLFNDV
jgi:putative flippase GtrA